MGKHFINDTLTKNILGYMSYEFTIEDLATKQKNEANN